MTYVIPIISDVQTGFHDRRAVDLVATFIADQGFDRVACVGDLLDCTEISQWARGNALEHAGNLAKNRDVAHQILIDFRVTDLSRSNHDDRLFKYVSQYAPGMLSLPELSIESILGLDEIGVKFHREPHAVAPGWLLMHGDESGSSRIAGGLAMGLARKTGKSVVCGHSHKLGLQHEHSSFSGKISRDIWGFEVGHLMDQSKASYLKAGIGNWSQGIGALVVDGRDVFPIPIPIKNHKLYWDGFVYSA